MNRRVNAFLIGAGMGLSCGAVANAQNLINNGDFETDAVGDILSDYVHTPGGNSIEGSWWVNPWDPGGPWTSGQHTPGGVAAMSANGDDSSQAGIKRVWYQTVAVTPGVTYRFGAWALATASGASGYSLRFDADDVEIGGVYSPTIALGYEHHVAEFVAAGSTVVVSIKNVSGITFPNDFMLDDITLTAVCAADMNDDQVLNFFDVQTFLNAYAAMDPVADFNDDTVFDFFDVLLYLEAFAAGCP